MYKIISLFSSLFLFGCYSGSNVDIKNLGDYNIVNVFSIDRYNELEKIDSKMVSCELRADDNYAYYSFLSLRPNRTYTMLLGNQYMFGTYEFLKDELILSPTTGDKISLMVSNVSDTSIQLYGDFKDFKSDFLVIVDDKSSFYINLRPVRSVDKVENDIRSQVLNEWRIKPLAPETDEEIKIRLMNNLDYIASYMYVNHTANEYFINVGGIRSPFRHAANGIILNEWREVDNYWKLIFFDEADAKKAYKLLKFCFERTYADKQANSWIELNELLIREVNKNIETTSFVN